jgi:tRNA pseudouridine38-40 synthase
MYNMVKTAFKVAYIGTDFYGFQRQPDLPTVEGELLKVFKKVGLSDKPESSGYSIAGRTDRGVHAMGNVVCLKTDVEVSVNQINRHLPAAIQIIGKTEVPNGFKPRYAEYRHYRYILIKNPHDDYILDMEEMQKASKLMEGEHNFQNFSKRSERDPIRRLDSIKITQKGDLIVFDVIGRSFLWNMVRKMVKILTMVGKGDMSLKEVNLLFNPDIPASITPVPPDGLVLMDVVYDGVEFSQEEYAKNNFMKTLKEEYIWRKTIVAVEEEMIKVLNVRGKSQKP